MKGAAVGYIRVSSTDQNQARQLADLKLDKTFEDSASGKDAKRPQLQACLEYLREGDTLYVHSIDRLARNLEDLQRIVKNLTKTGVTVHFQKENMTFSKTESANPMQNLMFQMLGAFAQFERDLIKERQREGIEQARRAGKQLGRAKFFTEEQAAEILARIKNGERKEDIAREYGVSRKTIYNYIRSAKDGNNTAAGTRK